MTQGQDLANPTRGGAESREARTCPAMKQTPAIRISYESSRRFLSNATNPSKIPTQGVQISLKDRFWHTAEEAQDGAGSPEKLQPPRQVKQGPTKYIPKESSCQGPSIDTIPALLALSQ